MESIKKISSIDCVSISITYENSIFASKENADNTVSNLYNKKSQNISTSLTLSWRRSLTYRNQSINLQSKLLNWFLYDRELRHERVKGKYEKSNSNSEAYSELYQTSKLGCFAEIVNGI